MPALAETVKSGSRADSRTAGSRAAKPSYNVLTAGGTGPAVLIVEGIR
jgi:hypothetical protein